MHIGGNPSIAATSIPTHTLVDFEICFNVVGNDAIINSKDANFNSTPTVVL